MGYTIADLLPIIYLYIYLYFKKTICFQVPVGFQMEQVSISGIFYILFSIVQVGYFDVIIITVQYSRYFKRGDFILSII